MREPARTEQLLTDAAWLRRLAIALAGNADDADDLVQQSQIAVWQQRPDPSRSLRPWLTKVMRDLAGMTRRSQQRRAARELAVPERDSPTPPDVLLEQVRLHRLVADLVIELAEPYRSTIVARFVDGQSSAEIARSQGIPDSTVRARLAHGLALLRAELDTRLGDRTTWAPAVLAVARGAFQVAKPTKTVSMMMIAIALLAAAVMTVAVMVSSTSSETRGELASRDTPTRGVASLTSTGALPDELARMIATQPPGWIAQDGAPPGRIAGRVIANGQPVVGAIVRLTSSVSDAGLVPVLERRCDADGHFDFGVQPPRPYAVGAASPGMLAAIEHVDVRSHDRAADKLVMILGPCVASLYGKVTDGNGVAIAHAQVLREDVIGAETDESGAYELCVLPRAVDYDETRVSVHAASFGSKTLALAMHGRVHHDFVLAPEAGLSGRAVTSTGQPVLAAEIVIAPDDPVTQDGVEQRATVRAASDADGRFHVDGIAAGRVLITARARGSSAAPSSTVIAVGETKDVTVVLEQAATVHGKVVHDGHPVPNVRVAVAGSKLVVASSGNGDHAISQADGTFVLDRVPVGEARFTTSPDRLRRIDIAGGSNDAGVADTNARIVAGDNAITLEVEALASVLGTITRHGTPVAHARVVVMSTASVPAFRYSAYSDDTGRYRFDGIEPAEVRIAAEAFSVGAFSSVKTATLSLGEPRTIDVELDVGARVSGRVVDASGAPVADAYVRLERVTSPDVGYDTSGCSSTTTGVFDCTMLAGRGTYRATVFPNAGGSTAFHFVDEPSSIEVPNADSEIAEVRLVVDGRRLAIRGIVVDSSGAPVPDTRVSIDVTRTAQPVPTTLSTPAGTFVLTDLAAGTYALVGERPDGTKSTVFGIEAGASNVKIVLDAPTCTASILHSVPSDILQRPMGRVVWGDAIELLGWSLPAAATLGGTLDATIYYRVLAPLPRTWKSYVHVDLPRKARINADHDPLDGRCPTATWRPGDILVDRFRILGDRPTPGAIPGTHTISIGWFRGSDAGWTNLPVTDAPDELRDPVWGQLKLTTIDLR